jgi:hypothetical protein
MPPWVENKKPFLGLTCKDYRPTDGAVRKTETASSLHAFQLQAERGKTPLSLQHNSVLLGFLLS